jgi:hypothetical protein
MIELAQAVFGADNVLSRGPLIPEKACRRSQPLDNCHPVEHMIHTANRADSGLGT